MAVIVAVSSRARARLDRARAWLADQPAPREVLVVAAPGAAAQELLRDAAALRGGAFGWHRATVDRLAVALTRSHTDRAPVGKLGALALVASVVDVLRRDGKLLVFGSSLDGPGFARAVAQVLSELRMAGVVPSALASSHPELASLLEAYEAGLSASRLADRSWLLSEARKRVRDPNTRHPWLDAPTLFLDVPLEHPLEADLVAAVLERSPEALVAVPAGDDRALSSVRALPGTTVVDLDRDAPGARAIDRLHAGLFRKDVPPNELDASVSVFSAPGESREAVEIARRILEAARDGTPFDRMAILLRSPEDYRAHVEEALDRADVPAAFARGVRRPHPAGRAFIALLACAADGLSARRFAEYLSLSQVPDADAAGAPPAPVPPAERWVAPEPESESESGMLSDALSESVPEEDEALASPHPEETSVRGGTLRSPRYWESLLVDAAVIGGRDRWERRLSGLRRETDLQIQRLEDPDDPIRPALERRLEELDALQRFALPLLDRLEALPAKAPWSTWLDRLGDLASAALRRPDRVLAVLTELAPMGPLGPVDLDHVRWVLEHHLLEIALPPDPVRYGKVFVGPIDAARGLAFDVVFVPGLAERMFPRKILEEPFLLDRDRAALTRDLATNADRLARERLSLSLALGAATDRIVFSFPRLDLERARPRVPSFYALEVLRAATGTLPNFEELAEWAERVSQARLGWPAPPDAMQAIDEAEHDLARLHDLFRMDPVRSIGGARYLLDVNPHLRRALRTRPRRWLRRWSFADGLVDPSEAGRAALARHRWDARSYSTTALQHYAVCPYRFYLSAVQRLGPREERARMERIDPLSRGSLVHEVQFLLLSELREAGALPVRPENLDAAYARLDVVLDETARGVEDDLAPAIEQVWRDAVASIRDDLREWMERMSEDDSGWVPWRFELSFGLTEHLEGRDPHSVDEPVDLAGGIRLRGSIDLVERRLDGSLRATDYKTGKERFAEGALTAGGTVLQPVLYALALERLFRDARVDSGRLYYCTASGGFQERSVRLDDAAREQAATLADVVGSALTEGFLPAAPAHGACRWCDYRDVCGNDEERRVARKLENREVAARVEPLMRLRKLL